MVESLIPTGQKQHDDDGGHRHRERDEEDDQYDLCRPPCLVIFEELGHS